MVVLVIPIVFTGATSNYDSLKVRALRCRFINRDVASVVRYVPTWIRERELKSPKTFRIHRTTAITTTPFKIDLMEPCMGMKRFTSHRRTPTTMRTSSN
jgi:hypothetical protein